jgi:hypothetical protein
MEYLYNTNVYLTNILIPYIRIIVPEEKFSMYNGCSKHSKKENTINIIVHSIF